MVRDMHRRGTPTDWSVSPHEPSHLRAPVRLLREGRLSHRQIPIQPHHLRSYYPKGDRGLDQLGEILTRQSFGAYGHMKEFSEWKTDTSPLSDTV